MSPERKKHIEEFAVVAGLVIGLLWVLHHVFAAPQVPGAPPKSVGELLAGDVNGLQGKTPQQTGNGGKGVHRRIAAALKRQRARLTAKRNK